MMLTLLEAVSALQEKKVIAYPTEAVFGVGCDPDCDDAILALLQLKKRRWQKGLILVAATYEQLLPYIELSLLSAEQQRRLVATWPGPVTWTVPKSRRVSALLSGEFDTIALRVSAHPVIQSLCRQWGKPVVSTSANISGGLPCRTLSAVLHQFGEHFPVLEGDIGELQNPTEIRHILTDHKIRQG